MIDPSDFCPGCNCVFCECGPDEDEATLETTQPDTVWEPLSISFEELGW